MNDTKQSPSTNGGEGNRQSLLKLVLAVGILAFAASITDVSCGKVADYNNNNNKNTFNNANTNTNTGGGNGGDTPQQPPTPEIVITNIDASVVEVKDRTNIELKNSGFPIVAINADIANTTLVSLATAPTNSLKRVFDIVITGGATGAATAGLVLVDIGSKPNANAFTTDAVNKALNSYAGTDLKEGLRNSAPIAADAANAEAAKAGWNIYAGFMNDTTPTSGAADATPFAFTATTGGSATHPVLFCRTTVSTITDGGNTGAAGMVQDSTVLTGGQKASCYVGSAGEIFTGASAEAWLNATAGNTFKKKFGFAAVGIRTDAKTVANIGLPGANKATAFHDGLNTADMTALTAANPSAFKKFSVSLVKDMEEVRISASLPLLER